MKMTKEDKVFNYLMDNIKIDINTLERILEQPKEALDLYGGIRKWYISSCPHFSECEKAIEYADYENPDSNETWEKVEEIKELVLSMKLLPFKYLEKEKEKEEKLKEKLIANLYYKEAKKLN